MLTKPQLIEQGFIPSPKRAMMSIPFYPAPACSHATYNLLPTKIQVMYTSQPENNVHYRRAAK